MNAAEHHHHPHDRQHAAARPARTAPSPSRARRRSGPRARAALKTIRRPMNTARVTTGVAPRGQHEGAQRRVEHEEHETDPEREPQDGVTTCMAVQLRRRRRCRVARSAGDVVRRTLGGQSSRRAAAVLLALRLAPLGVEPRPASPTGVGFGRRAAGGSTRSAVGEPRPQPFERELAVPRLRPGVGRGGPRHRAEPLEQPRPLARAERRRRRDREPHLDARVGRVGVLAAGAARAASCATRARRGGSRSVGVTRSIPSTLRDRYRSRSMLRSRYR